MNDIFKNHSSPFPVPQLAQVRNRDILVSSIAATGSISMIGTTLQRGGVMEEHIARLESGRTGRSTLTAGQRCPGTHQRRNHAKHKKFCYQGTEIIKKEKKRYRAVAKCNLTAHK